MPKFDILLAYPKPTDDSPTLLTPLSILYPGAQFESEGKTIDELIQAINKKFPGFANQLLEENGELRRFVNIYINDEDVRYLGGLGTELRDSDEVSILPALAGG